MKRKQLMSIDVTQSVMQRIERDGINMRPKYYFAVHTAINKILLVSTVIMSLLGFMSLSYVLRNDVFMDYKSLASQSDFIASLPWPGIAVTITSIILVVIILNALRKQSPNLKLSYAFGAWLVLIISALSVAGSLSSEQTPAILARAAYWSDKDPIRVYGEVSEIIDNNALRVRVGDETVTIYADTSNIKLGDKIVALGNSKNGELYAKVIKVVVRAPTKEKEIVKEKPGVTETTLPPEPIPAPEPVAKPTPRTPEPTPAPEPKPEPTKTISYTVIPDSESNPSKYTISWNTNFNTTTGWKLPYEPYNSLPSYPGSAYQYISDPGANSGTAVFKKSDLGVGKFNVRICAYDTSGDPKCPVYSTIILIKFFP